MILLEQVLGFYEWKSLNESDDSGKAEVYTNFEFPTNSPDLLYTKSFLGISPNVNSVKPILFSRGIDEVIEKYFSDFELEKVKAGEYLLKSEEGEEAFDLNFYTILTGNELTVALAKFNIQEYIKSNSDQKIAEGRNMLEYKLKNQYNSLPVKEILPRIFEDARREWLGDIDPNNFASDLESILVSKSVGGSFFNEKDLEEFKMNIIKYAAFEAYKENVLQNFRVTRDVIDLNDLDKELESKSQEIISQLSSGELTDDQAIETMRFIRYLTVRLREKGGKIKEKADSVLAKVMTVVQETGQTKKLMDFLIK
jgi:predicted transcriptional regulator